MAIRIGTSGWVYPHWRGLFYPQEVKQKDWFGYYVRQFDTVEINNSFYRLPSPAVFNSWRKQAPPGFVYSVKASQFLTHVKKLIDPEQPLQAFFEGAVNLKETLVRFYINFRRAGRPTSSGSGIFSKRCPKDIPTSSNSAMLAGSPRKCSY